MNEICTICGQPVGKGQDCIKVKTKRGTIYAHTACYEAEQRERKAEREWKA